MNIEPNGLFKIMFFVFHCQTLSLWMGSKNERCLFQWWWILKPIKSWMIIMMKMAMISIASAASPLQWMVSVVEVMFHLAKCALGMKPMTKPVVMMMRVHELQCICWMVVTRCVVWLIIRIPLIVSGGNGVVLSSAKIRTYIYVMMQCNGKWALS